MTETTLAALSAAGFVGFSLLCLLVMSWYSSRTMPGRVLTALEAFEDRIASCEKTARKSESNAEDLRADMASWVERMEQLDKTLDRRRRQLAAQAQRDQQARGGSGGDEEEPDLAAVRRQVLSGGFGR